MDTMAYSFTSLMIAYSTANSQIKENIKAPRHCEWNSTVTGTKGQKRKMVPFDDVIMLIFVASN